MDPLKLLRRTNERLLQLPAWARAAGWWLAWIATVTCFLSPSTMKLGFILLGLSCALGIEQAHHSRDLPMMILLLVLFIAFTLVICAAYDWFDFPNQP